MRAPSASELLQVWERGLDDGPVGRALELLGAACPESGLDALAGLAIGRRDALLLQLRLHTFGASLTGAADCAACCETIELALRAPDLMAGEPAPEASLAVHGYELRLRPPTSNDVAAVSDPDLARARLDLLERCLLEARYRGEPVSAAELPAAVIDEAERRLAEIDPQSDIRIVAACPACGAEQRLTFDIVAYFWREIDVWARRILREVHALASAYGWGEEEILALSPVRRQCYLDLVGA